MQRLYDEINIRDFIDTCSKCGMCKDECPVFEVEKTEHTSPRGKLLICAGVLNELQYKSKNKKNLRIAKYELLKDLQCYKCSKYCPSGIDPVDVFLYTKFKLFNEIGFTLKEWFMLRIVRINFFAFYAGKFFLFLYGKIFGNKHKKEIKFLDVYLPKASYYKIRKIDNKEYGVFPGCLGRIAFEEYLGKLCEKYKLSFIKETLCSGYPHYFFGDIKGLEKIVKKNVKIFNRYKYIVSFCPHCREVINKTYNKISEEKIKFKIISVNEFLEAKGISPKNITENMHLNCVDNKTKKCCGASSLIKYIFPEISDKIREKYFSEEEGITDCPKCALQLDGFHLPKND